MLVGSAVRRVAIVGGVRIPFARSYTVYATASNQDMLTATLRALVERYGLQSVLAGGRSPRELETERAIQSLTSQRDALVQQMKDVLDGSANGHREQLVREGRNLLEAAQALAGL